MKLLYFLIIGIFISLLFPLHLSAQEELDFEPLLVNGSPTTGYASAGYTLNVFGNSVSLCGAVVVSETGALTAAHCVETLGNISIGDNTISSTDPNNILISTRNIKPEYDGTDPTHDLAVLQLSTLPNNFTIATVTQPVAGCGYSVVGYGQSSDTDTSSFEGRLKQAIPVCISEITSGTFIVNPERTSNGFCFGDSGSPVFVTGTNEVVGIVSAVRFFSNQGNTNCQGDNEVIAVSIQGNSDFITQFTQLQTTTPVQNDPDVSSGDTNNDTPTPVIVDGDNLPEAGLSNVLSYTSLIGGIVIILFGWSLRDKKNK